MHSSSEGLASPFMRSFLGLRFLVPTRTHLPPASTHVGTHSNILHLLPSVSLSLFVSLFTPAHRQELDVLLATEDNTVREEAASLLT